MSTVNILDLTHTPAEQQLDKLVAALDGLAVGSSLEVQSGLPWGNLVAGLQGQRWGQFDWHPLEEGPDHWLAGLVRLEPDARNNTLVGFFIRDHRHCDTLYAEAENAANEGETARMADICHRFLVAMTHHFRMEEEGLFPAFEEKTGMRQGPTMVMRSEHEQMRGLMRQMHQAADTEDADLLLRAGGTLLFVMQQHNVKEEQMLYPMAEAHLRPAEPLLKEVQQL
ncbi:MAG: hemerythrin domain-containing protein [Magnetococcales bacterium]|nr:hemerythrin domain-containing protein [Magnetococcales bacterium]